ncbi:hypothetical protein B0J18DRAFT_229169 [Chaetomium sp. MPI-SDFR-AT-0129]|nr:hypothetical protein B0J18DRAFT_229169 [Chaetomium sp. MPI-SDFR-AT-0129]
MLITCNQARQLAFPLPSAFLYCCSRSTVGLARVHPHRRFEEWQEAASQFRHASPEQMNLVLTGGSAPSRICFLFSPSSALLIRHSMASSVLDSQTVEGKTVVMFQKLQTRPRSLHQRGQSPLTTRPSQTHDWRFRNLLELAAAMAGGCCKSQHIRRPAGLPPGPLGNSYNSCRPDLQARYSCPPPSLSVSICG